MIALPRRQPFALVTLAVVASFAAVASAQTQVTDLFEVGRKARADGRYGMLLRQFRPAKRPLPERQECGFRATVGKCGDERDIPAGHWVWQAPYWFVFRDGPDYAKPNRPWGPEAACGKPDTPGHGDHRSAYATLGENDEGEWLLLEYERPVRIAAIEVHENFNPGAIVAVSIFRPNGEEVELWHNANPGPLRMTGRVLKVDVPLGFVAERVKLTFACEKVKGWNEIDAVGLRDPAGELHWASRAAAHTTYATQVAEPVAAPPVVPPVIVAGPIVVEPPVAEPTAEAKAAIAAEEAEALAMAQTVTQAKIAELEAAMAKIRAQLEVERRKLAELRKAAKDRGKR